MLERCCASEFVTWVGAFAASGICGVGDACLRCGVPVSHAPRTLRVARGPFVDDSSRRAFVVRGDRAVRVPLVLGLTGIEQVEVVSGVSEGDELILSDMRDYLHLEQITIK